MIKPIYGLNDAPQLWYGKFTTTLEELGEVPAAKREYEAVLAGFTAALGARHPSTLNTQHCLAMLLYQDLGEREEGLRLMREAADGWATVLGPAHEDTKDAVRIVAMWGRQMA